MMKSDLVLSTKYWMKSKNMFLSMELFHIFVNLTQQLLLNDSHLSKLKTSGIPIGANLFQVKDLRYFDMGE